MWKSFACGIVGAASVVAPVLAQDVVEERIIQVAPDRDTVRGRVESDTQPVVPAYWIGLMGGPVTDELRAHLELPADKGILVREVVPNSPAEKAGIQQYDILLRAGGDELANMQDLVKHVAEAGEAQGKIEFELVRRGRQETATVAPEKRPEGKASWVGPEGNLREFNFRVPAEPGIRFDGPDGPAVFQFRNFGPDVLIGQPFASGKVPSGVSVTMKKEGDKPAEITVKRGEETWTVVEGDPKSLEQLPEDLRPLVANMARGNTMFRREMIPLQALGNPQPFSGNLQERLEAMERQMRELEEQFRNRETGEN